MSQFPSVTLDIAGESLHIPGSQFRTPEVSVSPECTTTFAEASVIINASSLDRPGGVPAFLSYLAVRGTSLAFQVTVIITKESEKKESSYQVVVDPMMIFALRGKQLLTVDESISGLLTSATIKEIS